MGDFTKEELGIIYDSIEHDYYVSNLPKNFYGGLLAKIQSMIDNYCAHDGIIDYIQFGPYTDTFPRCRKCGRII